MSSKQVALIVGEGAGLGAVLARRFSAVGLSVEVAARDLPALSVLAARIGPDVHAYRCDVTEEVQVERLSQSVEQDLGALDVAILNAGSYGRKSILESTKDDVETCWRISGLAGFFVGRAAVARGQ